MEYRVLGLTGLNVSPLCLGTMQFRWTTDEKNSYRVLDSFFDWGGNFIDTADIYSYWAEGLKGGESETIIGKWMKKRGNRRNHLLCLGHANQYFVTWVRRNGTVHSPFPGTRHQRTTHEKRRQFYAFYNRWRNYAVHDKPGVVRSYDRQCSNDSPCRLYAHTSACHSRH